MPDYRKMYFLLFNAVTSAVEVLENAQIDGEHEYMEAEDAPLRILPSPVDEESKAIE